MRNKATTPLSKAKVRQSWNKFNLYNLSRIVQPQTRSRTFFQQKWSAKSALRSYHGEQVRETQWTKMFRRRIRAVVPMNPEYLAINDGSNESAGRGAGLNQEHERAVEHTPYMNMTFAPLERRLDTAIFRALFASSARQARQLVVHGAVKVNGKQMRYPGYLLNPGDLFQVDPERVMYATGATKIGKLPAKSEGEEVSEDAEKADEEGEEKAADVNEQEDDIPEMDIDRNPREILKDLQAQAKSILSSERARIGAKKKQDLRAFTKAIKRLLSRSKNSTILTENLEAQFEELKNQLKIQRLKEKKKESSSPAEQEDKQETEDEENVKAEDEETTTLTDREYNELFAALTESVDNPFDPSKPYATPWRPRDYMSAFAFIPRYLEVNQNICAAVYLRHPVARPGLAEIPTPFGLETNAAAYGWYLRRR